MIASILDALVTIGSSVTDWLVQIFNSIVAIFYTAGVDGAEGSLTLIGVFALIALVLGVVFVVIKWISSFISLRRS